MHAPCTAAPRLPGPQAAAPAAGQAATAQPAQYDPTADTFQVLQNLSRGRGASNSEVKEVLELLKRLHAHDALPGFINAEQYRAYGGKCKQAVSVCTWCNIIHIPSPLLSAQSADKVALEGTHVRWRHQRMTVSSTDDACQFLEAKGITVEAEFYYKVWHELGGARLLSAVFVPAGAVVKRKNQLKPCHAMPSLP